MQKKIEDHAARKEKPIQDDYEALNSEDKMYSTGKLILQSKIIRVLQHNTTLIQLKQSID